MSVAIDAAFPGGNVVVRDVSGRSVTLGKELRDTSGSWFYWCFRARFDGAGTFHFSFDDGPSIGSRGPAVSSDGGLSWRWLGASRADEKGESFIYVHDGGRREVLFCVGMQYLESDFGRFLRRHSSNPRLTRSVLCRSRRGREVELLKVAGGGASKRRILLTSRHHCCEMMATHVMEGFLESALEGFDSAGLLRNADIFAVPFADKDGVEDGDQGKNRRPHDHARDYVENSIYPEAVAIKDLVESLKIDIVLDLHCPWLKGGAANEAIYFVGLENRRTQAEIDRLSGILEKTAPDSAPFFSGDTIRFGEQWNTSANYNNGASLALWASGLPHVSLAAAIEIPYANARDVTLDAGSARTFGGALAAAVLQYMEGLGAKG